MLFACKSNPIATITPSGHHDSPLACRYGNAAPGDSTMVDALSPAAIAAAKAAENTPEDWRTVAQAAAESARQGAMSTIGMKPAAGT